jgi:hypothetical protein
MHLHQRFALSGFHLFVSFQIIIVFLQCREFLIKLVLFRCLFVDFFLKLFDFFLQSMNRLLKFIDFLLLLIINMGCFVKTLLELQPFIFLAFVLIDFCLQLFDCL